MQTTIANELGNERVANVLIESVIRSVNLSEVVAKLADSGMSEAEVREVINTLGLDVIHFDTEMAYRAALLRPLTRQAELFIRG